MARNKTTFMCAVVVVVVASLQLQLQLAHTPVVTYIIMIAGKRSISALIISILRYLSNPCVDFLLDEWAASLSAVW